MDSTLHNVDSSLAQWSDSRRDPSERRGAGDASGSCSLAHFEQEGESGEDDDEAKADVVALVAMRSLKAKNEVFNTYGEYSNRTLLLDYGERAPDLYLHQSAVLPVSRPRYDSGVLACAQGFTVATNPFDCVQLPGTEGALASYNETLCSIFCLPT